MTINGEDAMNSLNGDDTSDNPKEREWVKIVSNDGFSFIVEKSVAFASPTLKNMLSPTGESCFASRHAANPKVGTRRRGVFLCSLF